MAEASSQDESCDSRKQRRAALLELPINLKNINPSDSPQFDAETIIETIDLLISIWEMYNRSVPEAYHHSTNPYFQALLNKYIHELDNPMETWYQGEMNRCGRDGLYGGLGWINPSEACKDSQFLRLLICAAHKKLSKMCLTTEKTQDLEMRMERFNYSNTELFVIPGLDSVMESV